jgi:hypothetical protein
MLPERPLAAKGGTAWARIMADNFAEMLDFHGTFSDLLHAANLRHGTDGFTSPPKEGVLRIFSPLKILGTKCQHATPRPPKPLDKHLV